MEPIYREKLSMDLRAAVMEDALMLEAEVNKLVVGFLNLQKDKLKLLGTRSSSLSFNAKITLLRDLDVLSDKEVGELNLVMEYRNKFLHLVECTSFVIADKLLDHNRRLIKFCPTDKLTKDDEEDLRLGYNYLLSKCADVLIDRSDKREKIRLHKIDTLGTILGYGMDVMERWFGMFDPLYKIGVHKDGDSDEVTELKDKLNSFLARVDESLQTQEFQKKHDEFKKFATEENLQNLISNSYIIPTLPVPDAYK